MLNSVMRHVKEALDGIVFPTGATYDGVTQIPALQAHVSVPMGTVITDGPHAFVWGGTLNRKRKTMGGPRSTQINTTSPFHDVNHRIDITLRWGLPSNLNTQDSIFPVVIDTVIEVLGGIPMSIQISDEQTGRPSTIEIIGEEFQVTYGQVYSMKDQRYWSYGAKITMPVLERVQQ